MYMKKIAMTMVVLTVSATSAGFISAAPATAATAVAAAPAYACTPAPTKQKSLRSVAAPKAKILTAAQTSLIQSQARALSKADNVARSSSCSSD